MTSTIFDTIAELKIGKYDYKIKVRVLKKWRGATLTGELFKGFNIILVDSMKSTIHAFIPGICAELFEDEFQVGKVCSIKYFTVQQYKDTDLYRCVRNDKQLILCKETKVQHLEDKSTGIPTDQFDFFHHNEIKNLVDQKTYLTDVVGIIKKSDFRKFQTQDGRNKSQAKFTITDGSSNVKVTFWDTMAMNYEEAMNNHDEKPVIIIISGGKVGRWQGEIEISNVAATTFLLNYRHHSVIQLRKRMKEPQFAQAALTVTVKKKPELLTVDQITKLNNEYIKAKVYAHITIRYVDDTSQWFYNVCTSCERQTEFVEGKHFCNNCKRHVPHPDKRYKINVVASDATGGIEVILQDREVRSLTGMRARQLIEQNKSKQAFPTCLKEIGNKDYTVQLRISEVNVVDHYQVYWATNICNGFLYPRETIDIETEPSNSQPSTSQVTSSTYNIGVMSTSNFQSV